MSDEHPTRASSGPEAAIGLEHLEVGPELVRARVPVTDVVRQPAGIVHGGIYALIAESVTSVGTEAGVGEDMVVLGQANSATFLRPIASGSIHATARVRQRGRTTWVWDVELTDDDERICALVRMILAVRPRRDGGPSRGNGW